MAQGFTKLSKTKKQQHTPKSNTAHKKKKNVVKNRPQKPKTANPTTKAIDRKNETLLAAKAVAVGTQFFLKDIAQTGKLQAQKMVQERNKKQDKKQNLTERLQRQLEALEYGTKR